MGWRQTQADVRSGKKSFVQKEKFEGFTKAADIIAKTWLQDARDKKLLDAKIVEEKRIEEKETRKATKAATEKAEAEALRREKNAKTLALRYSGDSNNSEAVSFFYQQLDLYDGNVGTVETTAQNMIKNNQLNFTNTVVGQELVTEPAEFLVTNSDGEKSQRPPSKVTLGGYSTFSNGRPITTLDLKEIAADEKNPQKIRDEANERLAELNTDQTDYAETKEVDVTIPGVIITPFGNTPPELDIDKIKTLDDISLYRQELTLGGKQIDAATELVLSTREQLLKDRNLKVTIQKAFANTAEAKTIVQTSDVLGETDTPAYIALKAIVDADQKEQKNNIWKNVLKMEELSTGEFSLQRLNSMKAAAIVLNAPQDSDEYKFLIAEIDKKTAQESVLPPGEVISLSNTSLEKLLNIQQSLALSQANNPNNLTPVDVATKEMVDFLVAYNGEKPEDLSEYLNNIGSVASTKARKIQINNNVNLDAGTKTKLIEILDTHIEDLSKKADELDLTESVVFGTVKIGETETNLELILNKEGGFYSPTLDKTFTRADIVGEPRSLENYKLLMGNATRLQESVFANLTDLRSGMTDLIIRAQSLDNIVKENEEVLTIIGGTIPAIIKRIEKEVGNLGIFFAGKSAQEVNSTINQFIDKDVDQASKELNISADAYSRYQSQLIEFAFTYARTGLGQVRTTDQDFQAAIDVVSIGSDYETFTRGLREIVLKTYNTTKLRHDGFLNRTDVQIARSQPGAEQFYAPFMINFDNYLQSTNDSIKGGIQWFNTEVPITSEESTEKKTVLTLGQLNSRWLNSGAEIQGHKAAYNNTITSQADKDTYLNILVKQLGLPKEVILEELKRGGN